MSRPQSDGVTPIDLPDKVVIERVFNWEQEPFIRDHEVLGAALVPAALWIETVLAGARALGIEGPLRLAAVRWLAPLALTAERPVAVELELEQLRPGVAAFRLLSAPADGGQTLFCEGQLSRPEPAPFGPAVALEPLRAQCQETLAPLEIYRRYEDIGLSYGPTLRSLRELRLAANQGLAQLEGRASRHLLHPGLLDGALQSLGAWIVGSHPEAAGAAFVPAEAAEIILDRPISGTVFAHLTASAGVAPVAPDGAALCGDIRLFNPAGEVLALLRGVTSKRVLLRERSEPPAEWLRRRIWRQQPATTPPLAPPSGGGWLLLGGGESARLLAAQLQGHNQQVQRHAWPPAESAAALVTALQAAGEFPSQIVLFAGEGTAASAEAGVLALLALVQALSGLGRLPLQLWLVTAATEASAPGQAALRGLARVIPLEHSNIKTGSIEFQAEGLTPATQAEQLFTELLAGPPTPEVLYRAGQRWLPELEPFSAPEQMAPPPFREQGIYLITGGLGGIGLEVADHLARRYQARLALVGRSPLPPQAQWPALLGDPATPAALRERLAKLQRLIDLGAELLLVSADIADREALTTLLAQVQARWGGLHGVIHAAGVVDDGLLRSKSAERFAAVLRPKMQGAALLAELTRPLALDFLLLFSSVSAVSGNIGQGDYAAANAYLDALAAQLRQAGLPALSLNWGPWQEVGMLRDLAKAGPSVADLHFIKPRQGVRLLEYALRQTAQLPPAGLPGSGSWVVTRLTSESQASAAQPAATSAAVASGVEPEALTRALKGHLTARISEILKIPTDQISPRQNFMELGFDSIMAVQVKTGLEKETGLGLDPTLLFEYPSINELAAYLAGAHPAEFAALLLPAAAAPPPPAAAPIAAPAPAAALPSEPPPAASAPPIEPLAAVPPSSGAVGDIAIIGLACRFPGAGSLEQFWQNLRGGVDSVTEVPASRWNWRDHYDPSGRAPATTVSKWGGFMENIADFEPALFGLSMREALQMDPQQRLFLEVTWEALEQAGYTPEQLATVRTGVYVGAGAAEYTEALRQAGRYHDAHTGSGNALSMIPNRLSYLFDWSGPSMTVDTACSSSLVALHSACRALRSGDIDAAVVGGTSLIVTADGAIIFGQAGMLSKEGRCRTFDARADGYVRGEGVAALLIKPLAAAERDGDPIWAVIKGSAVNHDGHSKAGLTAPNPKAQRRVVEEAWRDAGIDPRRVGYIEAHGTGTGLGDPIEIRGLAEAFRPFDLPPASCALGSVKSNIGHLETSAGLAGLFKLILALKQREIPASLHYESANPAIRFEETPFFVNDTTRPWPERPGPRLGGVSSFGFGGANAHVVVEEYPAVRQPSQTLARPAHLLTLSARTASALAAQVERLLEYLNGEQGERLGDICFTSNVGRRPLRHRLALVARYKDQLADKLEIHRLASAKGTIRGSLVFTGQAGDQAGDRQEQEAQFRSWALPRLQQLPTELCAALLGVCSGPLFEDLLLPILQAEGLPVQPQPLAWQAVAEEACVDLLSIAAQLFVLGVELEFERLHSGLGLRRIALPTYPFERQRCWPEPLAGTRAAVAVAGMAQATAWIGQPRSSGQATQFDLQLPAQAWPLADHQVQGRPVLPGMAMVELARQVVQGVEPNATLREIRGLNLSRPLAVVGGHVPPARLEAVAQGPGQWAITLAAEGDGQWQECARLLAQVDAVAPVAPPPVAPPPIDLAALRAQLADPASESATAERIYPQLAERGLLYGPGFRPIQRLSLGAREVVAELLANPNGWQAPGAIHPGLLDGALQAVGALLARHQAGTFVPFAVQRIRLWGAPLDPATPLICVGRPGPQMSAGLVQADAVIAEADSGRVVLEFEGIALRDFTPAKPQPSGAHLAGWLQQQTWQPEALAAPAALTGQRLLLLGEEPLFTGLVATRLREQGVDLHEADAERPAEFPALLQGLAEASWAPDAVIHLGRFGGPEIEDLQGLHSALERSGTLLFRLFQALLNSPLKRPRQLRIFTRGAQAVASARPALRPEGATLWGLAKSIAAENPSLAISCVDLDPRAGLEQATAQVMAELGWQPSGALAGIAYVGAERFRETWQPLPEAAPAPSRLRQGGVYLITGGLGGIGLELARYLAASCRPRLVLLGRSAQLAPELLAELHGLGAAEVVALAADVADAAALEAALTEARRRVGPLTGLFHAAGITRDSLLKGKSLAEWWAVLRAKTEGTWLLDRLTRQDRPELFVLFSSVAALEGNMGQGDYAAANRYLDSFASYRTAQSGLPSLALNWGLWDGVGLAQPLTELARARGVALIGRDLAMAALERALTTDLSQLAVAKLGLAPQPPKPAAEVRAPAAAVVETGLALGSPQLREAVQEEVLRIMAQVLEVDSASLDLLQNFLEMGFDSILAVRAVRELQDNTGLQLPATLLFDYPSIDALAGYLSEQPGVVAWLEGQGLTQAVPTAAPVAVPPAVEPPAVVTAAAPVAAASGVDLTPTTGVPIIDRLGLKLLERWPDGLLLRLPAGPDNLNHLGSLYAGAIFSFAEAAAALTLASVFAEYALLPVVAGSRINYGLPGLSDLQCEIRVTEADQARIRAQLASDKRAAYTASVQLRDAHGAEVATVELDFLLRLSGQGGAAASRTLPPPTASAPRPALPAAAVGAELGEEIAIIGLSGRFPAARNLAEFWQNLKEGRDCISEVSDERWSSAKLFDADPTQPGKSYTKWGGFMEFIGEFDPLFFGISPLEAEQMDPQQRLMLEVAWEALEDAGYGRDTPERSDTGVFVGVSSAEYATSRVHNPERVTAMMGLGNSLSIIANRLSYQFNLKGPSFVLDTACSSSLVAVHNAVSALQRGDCRMALAGGVHALIAPGSFIFFSKGGFMSPDGHCHTFDQAANGYVRGEGAGMVLLKPLRDALRDGDTIHAVIKGTAVNQDGRTNGLTAPNRLSQMTVLRKAYQRAGISPASLSCIEAHGTGTDLGDPIEVNALSEVFRDATERRQFCAIGSVKTQIGHLEPAAGIAALLKVVLSLKHRTLTPNLHFQAPNPLLQFEETPFYVIDQAREWQPVQGVRRAGISGFGFGGTNAHLVLEEAPATAAATPSRQQARALVMSARSEGALRQLAGRYADYFSATPSADLAAVAYTAANGRTDFLQRLAVTGASAEEFARQLRAIADHGPTAHTVSGSYRPGKRPRVAFLFTGQGSQFPGMAKALYAAEPVFRESLDRCAQLLADQLEKPLLEVMFGTAAGEPLNQTGYTQPALFALQVALVALLKSWGIEPDAVLGHSVGEFAAAHVAGALSLEEGLALIASRGRAIQALPAGGGMAAVLAPAEVVQPRLAAHGEGLAIAALNGPANTVVSGPLAALETLLTELEEAGYSCHPLKVSHAFHSALMEPALAEFATTAQALRFQQLRLPLASNLTGALLGRGETPDADYWCRHIRAPVRFAEGFQALLAAGSTVFIEIGPHPVLVGMAKALLPETAKGHWVPLLQRGRDDLAALAEAQGRLYVAGVNLDWGAIGEAGGRQRVPLPTYPFERQHYWIEADNPLVLPPATAASSAPAEEAVAAPPAAATFGIDSFVDVME